MNETGGRSIHAVRTTCRIVEALKTVDSAGVTDLARQLDRSKSTVYNHLQTLEEEGFVTQSGLEYRLSLKFLDVAANVRDQFEYDVIKAEVDELADASGEVANFGVLENGRVRYLYKAGGDEAVETVSTVGMEQPTHSTALGKAILAHTPAERVDALVERRGLPALTDQTITDREELFTALSVVRERGYAIDDEENVEGLRCVAAPVQGIDGNVTAVSVSGPSSGIAGETVTEALPSLVSRSANVIELNSKFG